MSDTIAPTPQGYRIPEEPKDLQTGHLGRTQLISLSLASFVPAVGMALVPMLMFSAAGVQAWPSALLSMFAVICVGVAVISFARRFVASGSLYSYIGEAFGPWARYLTAAGLFTGFVVQVAAIAGIIGIFTGSFLTSLGIDNALELGPQSIIYVGAIGIGAFVAIRGLDTSVRVAVALAFVSIPLMVLITIASGVHTGLDLSEQLDFSSFSLNGTLQGVAGGAAFLVGFESCTSLAAETRDPKRNVPLAVMSVPVLLGVVYLGCTIIQTPGLAAASDALSDGVSPPAALAVEAGLPSAVATATDLVLAIATFASMIGFLNYGARFAMTLGLDGLLPARSSAIHSRYHSPYIAIGILSVAGFLLMSSLVLVSGTVTTAYNAIATLCVYAWIPPYLLIAAGAIALSLKQGRFSLKIAGAAVLGGVAMGWVYINGIINPPPAPLDAMSWVVVVVIVLMLAIFGLTSRAGRSRLLTDQTTGGSDDTDL
ncbi:APC family permease [Rhodococcus jostii]|uniref:APC family permease n=1 Tax=Rhodococcus jostii TaxID=132919 RepID=A0ABU4CTJ6_RHOJO|nr:APC family permease [Rhodococcus jostii]MDV6286607.1 APC family permease [Rhodococcus jostii]